MNITDKEKEMLAYAFSGAMEDGRVVLEFTSPENSRLRVIDITEHVDQLEQMIDND